jgi:hypothetical protein
MGSLGRSLVTVAAEGTPQSLPLTFEARAVQVHNLSASWLYVPDAAQPVPPFTYGAVLPLQGTSQARVTWQTPPGLTAPTTVGGQVTLLWCEDALPPSNGQQVVVPSQQVLCKISSTVGLSGVSAPVGKNTVTIGAGGGSATSIVFNVPPGTNSVIVLGTGGANTTVTLTGVQSGTTYFSGAVFFAVLEPVAFVYSSAGDTQLSMSFASGGAPSAGDIQLSASPATQAVFVENGIATPLYVLPAPRLVATPSVSSATNANQTMTLVGTPGAAWYISAITVSFTGATAGFPNVSIDTGGSPLWLAIVRDGGTTSVPAHYFFGSPGMSPSGGVPNTSVNIKLTASGVGGIAGWLSVVSSLF